MDLIPDKSVNVITFRESFYHVVLMFPYPFDKIRGDTNIKGSVRTVGQNIDTRLFQGPPILLDSG